MEAEPTSLTIDVHRCTFCRACELACSFAKEGVFAPEWARIRVLQLFEHGVNVPLACINCDAAACIDSCPTEAIARDATGTVQIDQDLCTACEACVEACPYAAVWIPQGKETAVMCDLCGGDPACVKCCIYGALRYEGQPDGLYSALDLAGIEDPPEARRWALAERVAETLRAQWEVEV